jgi:lipopolysaccharide export system permease protein
VNASSWLAASADISESSSCLVGHIAEEVGVFWGIIHRTILWELFRVFALSLVGITGMLVMAGIIAEATQHGLAPNQVLAAIPLLVPSTLPYTIPATTLFATCVVYGRLAADNEILAIKAAGINILRVVWPGVLLGIAMSLVTMWLYYDIIPTTHHLMRAMVMRDVEEFLYSALKRERCIRHPSKNYTMHVKTVQGRMLIDPVFVRRDPKSKNDDIIARADEAEMRVDLQHKQILFRMYRCRVSSSNNGDNGYFEFKEWPVDLPADFVDMNKKYRPGDMTWDELFEYVAEMRKSKEKTDAELALMLSLDHTPRAPEDLTDRVKMLRFASRQKLAEIHSVEAEMLNRPALAFGCLCFVVVGCPIGIWFSKSDYLSAFITCFLPIVMIYYPLLLCGSSLAKNGSLHPFLALWAANGLMALTAVPLYRKLLKN